MTFGRARCSIGNGWLTVSEPMPNLGVGLYLLDAPFFVTDTPTLIFFALPLDEDETGAGRRSD
jgi:hypothetical protein